MELSCTSSTSVCMCCTISQILHGPAIRHRCATCAAQADRKACPKALEIVHAVSFAWRSILLRRSGFATLVVYTCQQACRAGSTAKLADGETARGRDSWSHFIRTERHCGRCSRRSMGRESLTRSACWLLVACCSAAACVGDQGGKRLHISPPSSIRGLRMHHDVL